MLSKSRFSRRLHAIPEAFWQQLSFFLPEVQQDMQNNKEFIIDSFPLPACENVRIKRRHLLKGEQYRGKCVSKKKYFLGVKAHVLMTSRYCPIEWILTPGSENDTQGMHRMNFNVPEGSTIYADAGYTDYQEEDLLLEAEGVKLYAQRKSNSKRKRAGWLEFIISMARKKVGTGFSIIAAILPKSIHAVTDQGFMIKCTSFITAFTCYRAMASS